MCELFSCLIPISCNCAASSLTEFVCVQNRGAKFPHSPLHIENGVVRSCCFERLPPRRAYTFKVALTRRCAGAFVFYLLQRCLPKEHCCHYCAVRATYTAPDVCVCACRQFSSAYWRACSFIDSSRGASTCTRSAVGRVLLRESLPKIDAQRARTRALSQNAIEVCHSAQTCVVGAHPCVIDHCHTRNGGECALLPVQCTSARPAHVRVALSLPKLSGFRQARACVRTHIRVHIALGCSRLFWR